MKIHIFSSTHRTFTMTYYVTDHKIYLNKFKRIQVLQSIFLTTWDYEINNQRHLKNTKIFRNLIIGHFLHGNIA